MDRTYWLKQTPPEPLFPDLLWGRPENKNQAGKLLIIGGNAHGFSAPAQAYIESQKAGIGVAKVVLPDALRKVVGSSLENTEFVPSTPSGSFSQKALAEILSLCQWADGLLLAGELGRNSETAIVVEQLLKNTVLPLVITKDSVDYFYHTPELLCKTNVALVLTIAQLQKLSVALKSPHPITFTKDLLQCVDGLHELTTLQPFGLVTKHQQTMVVASSGQVSTTPLSMDQPIWRVPAAAHAVVWYLQNPKKRFEALSSAILR